MRDTGCLLAAILALACGGPAESTAPPSEPEAAANPNPTPARAAFDAIERQLIGAGQIELTARITAEGPVHAALEGTLLMDGSRVILGFDGAFEDREVQLSLTADGNSMSGGNGTLSFEHARPRALDDGLLIGLLRMGILHNLTVLASGNPPQGTFGNVREWVQVHDVRREDDHFAFDIEIDGKRVASAKLWLDATTGLPARREQTVRFPSGTMTVVETYDRFIAR